MPNWNEYYLRRSDLLKEMRSIKGLYKFDKKQFLDAMKKIESLGKERMIYEGEDFYNTKIICRVGHGVMDHYPYLHLEKSGKGTIRYVLEFQRDSVRELEKALLQLVGGFCVSCTLEGDNFFRDYDTGFLCYECEHFNYLVKYRDPKEAIEYSLGQYTQGPLYQLNERIRHEKRKHCRIAASGSLPAA